MLLKMALNIIIPNPILPKTFSLTDFLFLWLLECLTKVIPEAGRVHWHRYIFITINLDDLSSNPADQTWYD
jgi:hypothetical protein